MRQQSPKTLLARWLSIVAMLLLTPAAWGQTTSLINGSRVITGSVNYCGTTSGTSTAYTCSYAPAITAYHTGTRYSFKVHTANGAAPSINVNGLGAKTIKKVMRGVTTDLVPNDLQTNQIIDVIYDGTNMQMLSQLGQTNMESFTILVGSDDASSVLTNAQLGPQHHLYTMTRAATIQQISVYADAGTPNVLVHRRTGTTDTNLLSSALATAASGALACAKTSAIAGIEGTTCSATLQNASVTAGHTIGLTSGTAGGTAKRMSIMVFYTFD